jgi:hypothetical protein
MIPQEARSWSPVRVRQEIANREREKRDLEEAIRFHEQEYERFPEGGFGGNDLYSKRNELEIEIGHLTSLL